MTSENGAGRGRRWKWPVRILLTLALLVLALASPMACTTTVTPPEGAGRPLEVFLIDHGRTSSLVLPAGDGGMFRYAYGDWDYYALGEHGWGDAIAALCWPTRGALGRENLEGPAVAGNVRDRVGVPIEHLYTIRADRGKVRRLRERLGELFRGNLRTRVENPSVGLSFVHAPESYTYFRNSNHAVAGWLAELGCDVSGPAFASRWQVRP